MGVCLLTPKLGTTPVGPISEISMSCSTKSYDKTALGLLDYEFVGILPTTEAIAGLSGRFVEFLAWKSWQDTATRQAISY